MHIYNIFKQREGENNPDDKDVTHYYFKRCSAIYKG